MKIAFWLLVTLLLTMAGPAAAVDGLIVLKSAHAPGVTIDRLEAAVKGKGLNVFARIDHAAGAAKIGKTLRPTELLIFGNPQGGTPFMECSQTVGIDLPLKALAWQDAAGASWLGYDDPGYLAARHGAAQCPVVENLKKALAAFAKGAVAP
ncbi:MAG: DUF302 domain-containing protein [Burkholderiales bacterium]